MPNYNRQVRWWVLVLVMAISLYLCWLMIQPFIGVLAWAAVLVIVFYPVHRRLVQRTKRQSRGLALHQALADGDGPYSRGSSPGAVKPRGRRG